MAGFLVTIGVALALCFAAAAVELSLAPLRFGSALVALRHTAAAGLLLAAIAVPVTLALSIPRSQTRRGGPANGLTDALVALAAIASLYALRATHASIEDSPVSPVGLAATAGSLLAIAAVTWAVSRGLERLFGRQPLARSRRILAGLGIVSAAGALALTLPMAGAASTGDRANVVLISIDSVRADTFRALLESGPPEPLRSFAARARSFDRAYTTYTHSLPSHASMLTGLYPPEHGAVTQTTEAGVIGSAVAEDVRRLAERFAAAGYETIGIMANHWLGPPYGLERGVATYVSHGRALVLDHFDWTLTESASIAGFYKAWALERARGAHWNSRAFVTWLRQRDRTRPFFAFLHYIDMHVPHDPAPEFRAPYDRGPFARASGTGLSARLDRGEIAAEDTPAALARIRDLERARLAEVLAWFSPVLSALAEREDAGPTLVILTSDHGDNLYEKDGTYGHSQAYETSGRVPLLLHGPGVEPGSNGGLASLVDLTPTILRYAGLPPDPDTSGVDLLADTGEPRGASDWIYLQGTDARHQSWAKAVVWGDGLKFIRDATHEQVFDLAGDASEQRDLAGSDPELASRLRSRFDAVLASLVARGETEPVRLEDLDDDTKAGLRALGYID